MTSEERVNEYYWWVLGRIKEQLDTTPSNRLIRYELSHVGAAGVPNNETEENIIRKLEELKALQIINEFPRESGYSSRHTFELKVIQPTFDEIYRKYKYLCDPSSKADYKTIVKNLSSNTKKVLLEIVEKLEGQAETTPTGQSVYFEVASYRSDGINEKSLVDKLEEWGILTVEGEDEEYGHPVVSISLDKLKLFKKALVEDYSVHDNASSVIYAGNMPEDLVKAIRWIMQKIKKEYIAIPSGEQVYFKFVVGEVIIMGRPKTVPSFDDQQLALKVLGKEKAIKISEYVYTSRMTGQYSVAAGSSKLTGARLVVLQPNFDEFYKQFSQFPHHESASQEEFFSNIPTPITPQQNKVYTCGSLEINITAATLRYKDNSVVDIQPQNREIKFLVALIKNMRVVEYSEIAEAIDSTSFGEEVIARAVQYLKRDLKPVLKKAGMTDEEIKKMIKPVRNTGYKIVCPQ